MPTENKPYTAYELARWSMRVRQRDNCVCFMCKRQALMRSEVRDLVMIARLDFAEDPAEEAKTIDILNGLLAEAHHIRAKFHYPKLALRLDNGITLCWRCHRRVVHSTYETFRIYTYPFRVLHTLRGKMKEFNEKYQPRIDARTQKRLKKAQNP